MSVAITIEWELLRCQVCGHEYTRQIGSHQLALPCTRCHGEMTRLPLAITHPERFSLRDMTSALGAARDQASTLAITATRPLERARYHGMALAYQEALEMLTQAQDEQP